MSSYTRGRGFENLCARMFGGVRQRNDYKGGPDVISRTLVISCKRVSETGIRGSWINQARGYGRSSGKPWILVRALTGSPNSVVVMDTKLALELLRTAGMIPDMIEVEPDDVLTTETP